jgi:hypothetical protein
MSVSPWRSDLGRHVFGLAALAFGLITLAWHDYDFQLVYLWNAPGGPVLVYAAAIAQIVGGAAIQFRRTAKVAALVLGVVYLVFALLYVPGIIAGPLVYDHWGNFFEQFSLVTGAALVYAHLSARWTPDTVSRVGRICIGLCAMSFAFEQAFYLAPTEVLVPKWLPPGQVFWAVATTVAFALAAVALLTNRMALLATRLLTAMLVIFGLLVWLPLLFKDLHNHANWGETLETFAIAGAAWILADLLGEYQLDSLSKTRAPTTT